MGELGETRGASTDDTLGAEGSGAARPDVDELARGATLGRYVVLDVLGAGGMGVVYAAYDPELDRKVAVKVLQPTAAAGSAGRSRLLREAQALAKLSHPNIVAVHDVGTLGERVWIAMEFIAGTTLGGWLGERSRSWQELVPAMIAAGRGLAAAHAAGLVHRDFKPDNVMITPTGVAGDHRVRVMDFGLARAIEAAADEATGPTTADAQPRLATWREALTRDGAVAGTPAYMAPEQFATKNVDARADQFSFCVATWEGLYGERPFQGGSLIELAAAVTGGAVRAPARSARVPGWLRRAVQRGLSASPDDRWPTMDALLETLARGQSRVGARRSVATIGGLALVGMGALAAYQLGVHARTAECEQVGAGIAEVWNDDARARVRAAILASGVSYAETTADRVMPWLEQQAHAWQSARTEACLDAEVRQLWDVDARERSLWCFDERRMELEALIAELSVADERAVGRAVSAAAGLRDVDACRDARVLGRLPPPPPAERREEVRALQAELSRAGALGHAGKYAEGLELARAVHDQAASLDWPPLSAAAGVLEAAILQTQGSYEAAEQLDVEAYFQAAQVGAWDVAARAAGKLVFIVGYQRARHDEGLAWGRHAELAEAYAGDPEGLRQAERLGDLATVNFARGDHVQARAQYERALAIQEEVLGADHPDVGDTLNNLANLHLGTGDYAQARALLERAVVIREHAFGADHPNLAASLNNLATVDHATGDYAHARVLFERALAIWEKALGPEHPLVATCISNLAGLRAISREYREARPLFERALAIRERTLGPDHPDVASTLSNLGLMLQFTGDLTQSRALLERALAIKERSLGPDHPDVADGLRDLATVHYAMGEYGRARTLNERALAILGTTLPADHPDVAAPLANLALVYQVEGDYAGARKLQQRALAIREKALGPDHPDVATSLVRLADLELAAGDAAAALPLAERALAIHDRDADVHEGELDARFSLARALVATGGDSVRARALAEQARTGWRADAAGHTKDLDRVDAWLAAHPEAR